MGAWEKFQLGWLNYQVAYAGKKSEHKLGPMESNTKQAQGLFVILPKKTVVTNIGAPFAGTNYYYSGAGDNLDNFMYKSFNLAGGRDPDGEGEVQHRARLGLRLPGRLDRQRRHLDRASRPTSRPRPTPTARTSASASPASRAAGST